VKLLSLDYRRELKRLRKLLRGSGDDTPLTWEEIVEDARDMLEYNSLTPEDSAMRIQGFTQQDTNLPESGQIAATMEKATVPRRKAPSVHLNDVEEDVALVSQATQRPTPQPSGGA
jgi:hypothetical protein